MKTKIQILLLILSSFYIFGVTLPSNIALKTNIDLLEQPTDSKNHKINMLQNKETFYAPSTKNESISCVDSEKVISSFAETFHFTSSTNIDNVISTGHINLLNVEINNNQISCTLANFPNDESVILKFYNDNNLIDNVSLYFSKSSTNDFYSSSLSLDTAKRKAGKTLNYQLSPIKEDKDDQVNYDDEIALMGIGSTGSVSGTFKWTDDEGNVHPLIGAKIEITVAGSWWSDITYTNQDGYYKIIYDDVWHLGSGKPTITLYADNGESIYVTTDDEGIYSKAVEMPDDNGDFTYSYTFSPVDDGDMGKAMIIFQAAKNFSDYAKSQNNNQPVPKCCFKFPCEGDSCRYSNNVVYIANVKSKYPYLPSTYSSWDVIGHEYGHHIQGYYGLTASPGGRHNLLNNLIDQIYNETDTSGHKIYSLEEAKDRGLKLAWGESLPTYWSIIAQTTFSDDLKTIPTVGDSIYTAYNAPNQYMDMYPTNPLGDANENSICGVLYKLTSSTQDEYDKFSIDQNVLWNLIVEKKPNTFHEFINALYDEGFDKNDLGKLLGKYKMAISKLNLFYNYLDTCPEFYWQTSMGSNELYFDSFDLVVLNQNGDEILRKENLTPTVYKLNIGYTLTREEWANVIEQPGRTFYAYIIARQTLSFVSGNYYSELFEFTEPDDFDKKVQIKSDEWGFEPQYFFETNKEGHTSTTITDHGLTINTERLRCGYIENSFVILSPMRENAGLAYLELTFDKPVYSYMFGITLWSKYENLNRTTCTGVVEVLDKDGNWTVDWDLFNDLPKWFPVRTERIDRYASICSDGIYGLRFVLTSPAVGERNKGRLCLDDIVLNTDPNDLEFITTSYE